MKLKDRIIFIVVWLSITFIASVLAVTFISGAKILFHNIFG